MGAEQAIDWSNVLATLLIRFVAVFVILGVLQIGLYISGAIVSGLAAAKDRQSQPGQP